MTSIPVTLEDVARQQQDAGNGVQFVRVIVADTQAIFRAGLRKIFALEDDIRVVGQAETLAQAQAAAARFAADLMLFEASLAPSPVEAVTDLLRQSPKLRLVVVTDEPNEQLTLELFRRGAHGIISREVEPEALVECVRKVAGGETWLDRRGMQWVMEAYRTNGTRPVQARTKVQLTPKESQIVGCVTQGMKNREIAARVGTTEQVVKNYLRKVYDKLGVADRLELALYCLNNRVLDGVPAGPAAAQTSPSNGNASAAAAAAGAGAGFSGSPNPEKVS